MSLMTRLTVFFLAILAVVLIGFSSTLFVVQRWALLRQSEERLTTARKALVASIEIEHDGVEWNPHEHQLEGFGGDPRWRVIDDAGRVIDETGDFPAIQGEIPTKLATVDVGESTSRTTWWVASERVAVPAGPPPEEAPATDGPDPDDIPEYPALTIVVAMPTANVTAELNRLVVLLVLLSTAVFAIASIFSRTLARRALRPISEMAAAAGAITADSAARLPVPASRDELSELGGAFNRLLDRLGAVLDRERSFTAEASHQLRTPITALLGQIDVVLRRERSATEYRDTLRSARDQADRLRRIVESLLTLARSESQALPRAADRIALEAWLPRYAERWAGRTGSQELQLDLAHEATIQANSELLGQLLDVFVENAIKYTPPATPVTLRLTEEQGRATLDVLDAGPGVPDAEAAAIFRPFHRGSDAIRRGIPGVGLGLALAARIAEHIGAELAFDRPPEGGSRFRIRFRQPALPAFSRKRHEL